MPFSFYLNLFLLQNKGKCLLLFDVKDSKSFKDSSKLIKKLKDMMIDLNQEFSPKLVSKMQADGTMITPPLEDMWPFLSKEELEFLLKLVADSKFDGKDVQLVYQTAVKLQKIITE